MTISKDAKPMSRNEYRRLVKQLNLNQTSAAHALGVSLRTSAGYATGSPIPLAVAKLLRLWAQLKTVT